MYLDQNPDYKKTIAPWYDSEVSCYLIIFMMLLVLVFGFIGISVVNNSPHLTGTTWGYLWVPLFLVLMSGIVILSITIRLIRRYTLRFQNRYLKNFSADEFD